MGDERRSKRMNQVMSQVIQMWVIGNETKHLNKQLEGGWVIIATHMDENGSILYILGDPS